MKIVYSPEETARIIELYNQNLPLEEISEKTGKSKKSLISKLVKEGVYRKQEVQISRKILPSKKEIVRDLEVSTGLQFEALAGANKSDLLKLLAYLKGEKDANNARSYELSQK